MTEPFIITCETCQSRLRVRSEAAVGSILACPKCQSLVHVTPPEESGPASASPATDEGQNGPDALPPGKLLPVKVALAAVVSAAIGAGLFVGFGRSPESDNQTRAGGQVVAGPAAAKRPSPSEFGKPSGHGAAVSVEEQAIDKTSTDAEAIDRNSGEDSGASGSATDASARPPALPSTLPAPEETSAADDAESSSRGQRDVPPVGIAELDFDFLPNGGVFSGTAPPVSDVVDRALPPESGERSELTEAPPQPPASTSVRMTIARDSAEGPSQGAAEPTEALSLPLVEVDFSKTSAVQAVRLIAELTGTTITVTPEAYRALQGATVAIATRQLQATAGDALAAVLKPHGLHLEQRGSHMVVLPVESLPESNTGAESGQLAEKLQRPVTFTYTTPTPLAEVLQHLERAGGLTMLVDWQSLAERKLGPASLITASVVDQPLGDVLDGLLPQLGIGCSPVGDAAVWITAR